MAKRATESLSSTLEYAKVNHQKLQDFYKRHQMYSKGHRHIPKEFPRKTHYKADFNLENMRKLYKLKHVMPAGGTIVAEKKLPEITYKIEANKIENKWKPGPKYPKENPQKPSFVEKNLRMNNSMN